ncbi:hypothetical protein SASPL_136905 [Salvia splendens]|uniref:PGG domain-containing protein n=1 Tax=Salvia splendens TaxID=180675 RepID=A0A8X8ZHB2_SALSN|nr:hypothetical protein SASPL_136905 [Salvia splendens]
MAMVVVGLIAAMAFSAAVSPPGGVWQDDTSSHRAGKAVMASSHPKLYKLFSRANTTAFVSALLVIFLQTINAPNRLEIFFVVILYATLVAMASIGVSYGASVIITNPAETQTVGHTIAVVSAGRDIGRKANELGNEAFNMLRTVAGLGWVGWVDLLHRRPRRAGKCH